MKDRANAADNMQASRSVAAALTIAIQTPRLEITVVPKSNLIQLQYSHPPPILLFWNYWLCIVPVRRPLQCNPVIRFIHRTVFGLSSNEKYLDVSSNLHRNGALGQGLNQPLEEDVYWWPKFISVSQPDGDCSAPGKYVRFEPCYHCFASQRTGSGLISLALHRCSHM